MLGEKETETSFVHLLSLCLNLQQAKADIFCLNLQQAKANIFPELLMQFTASGL